MPEPTSPTAPGLHAPPELVEGYGSMSDSGSAGSGTLEDEAMERAALLQPGAAGKGGSPAVNVNAADGSDDDGDPDSIEEPPSSPGDGPSWGGKPTAGRFRAATAPRVLGTASSINRPAAADRAIGFRAAWLIPGVPTYAACYGCVKMVGYALMNWLALLIAKVRGDRGPHARSAVAPPAAAAHFTAAPPPALRRERVPRWIHVLPHRSRHDRRRHRLRVCIGRILRWPPRPRVLRHAAHDRRQPPRARQRDCMESSMAYACGWLLARRTQHSSERVRTCRTPPQCRSRPPLFVPRDETLTLCARRPVRSDGRAVAADLGTDPKLKGSTRALSTVVGAPRREPARFCNGVNKGPSHRVRPCRHNRRRGQRGGCNRAGRRRRRCCRAQQLVRAAGLLTRRQRRAALCSHAPSLTLLWGRSNVIVLIVAVSTVAALLLARRSFAELQELRAGP